MAESTTSEPTGPNQAVESDVASTSMASATPGMVELIHAETHDEWIARKREFPDSKDERQLSVNNEALELLESFPSPFAVVAVTGKARSGKSTLLNMLLQYLGEDLDGEVFATSAGNDTMTAGIDMYNRPVPIKDAETGETRFHLVVLDTEGTERGNDTVTAQITAVAALLSSLLVLHVQGGFTNVSIRALSRMHGIIDLAEKEIDLCNSQEELGGGMASSVTVGETHADMYPRLMVVSRGMDELWIEQSLKHKGGNIDILGTEEGHARMDAILESQLAPQGNGDPLDGIREGVREWFRQRSYHVTVTTERADRVALDQTPPSLVPGEFKTAYEFMLKRIVDSLEPKRVDQVVMTTSDLASILVSFAAALREGQFSLPTVLFTLQRSHGENIVREQLGILKAELESFVAFDGSELDAIDTHVAAVKLAHTQASERIRQQLAIRFEDDLSFISVVTELLLAQFDHSAHDVLYAIQSPFFKRRDEIAKQRIADMESLVMSDRDEVTKLQQRVAKQQAELDSIRQRAEALRKQKEQAAARLRREQQRRAKSCCIGANTVVKFADGTLRKLKRVRIGDVVRGLSGNTTVFWVDHRQSPIPFLELSVVRKNCKGDGETSERCLPIFVTAEHLVYADGRLVPARLIRVGSRLRGCRAEQGNAWLEVVAIRRTVECPSTVLTTDGHVVTACGSVVSCYEVSHTWGILEAMDMRALYATRATRWVLHTKACKYYSDGCDRVLEPLLHITSHSLRKVRKWILD